MTEPAKKEENIQHWLVQERHLRVGARLMDIDPDELDILVDRTNTNYMGMGTVVTVTHIPTGTVRTMDTNYDDPSPNCIIPWMIWGIAKEIGAE